MRIGRQLRIRSYEAVLIDKISLLLNVGYQEVYLITDHAFVLTGLLEEADKIDPNVTTTKRRFGWS